MSQAQVKKSTNWIGILTIPVAFVVSVLVFIFIFGAADNFNADHSPKGYFGTIYEGGIIVPLLMTLFLTVFTIVIERLFTIASAKGKGSLEYFLQNVKSNLSNGNVNAAIADCDKQNTDLAKDQKVLAISKEMEEAVSLELPMLEKNLNILATIASVATLLGLLGTVLGMIRAFAALAASGTPDPGALSSGISEALINTAIGIGTSALAIIFYNLFTGMIDKLTYGIDEMGFSISQTFASKNK